MEVVMKAAGLLTHGQLEGLGAYAGQAHPKAVKPSCPPMAVVVQPTVVVG